MKFDVIEDSKLTTEEMEQVFGGGCLFNNNQSGDGGCLFNNKQNGGCLFNNGSELKKAETPEGPVL